MTVLSKYDKTIAIVVLYQFDSRFFTKSAAKKTKFYARVFYLFILLHSFTIKETYFAR